MRASESGMLVVQVEGEGRTVVDALIHRAEYADVKLIAVVSPDVTLDDDDLLLWGIFTRFDCARDMIPAEFETRGAWTVCRGPMGIDATFKPGYPEPVANLPEVISRVVVTGGSEGKRPLHLLRLQPRSHMPYQVGIVGGSLAGLAAANALHRLGPSPHTQPTIEGDVLDAAIIADGGFSSLRHHVNGHAQQPEYAGQMVFRAKLGREHFPDFSGEGGYEERDAFAMMLQVVQDNGRQWIMGGIGVGVPESEVVRPKDGVNRQEMTASQPLFEFKADRITNGRLILIGDAANMASPRTAAGAHTGVLDGAGLLAAFSENPTSIDAAIAAYAPGGQQRASALYARSKEVSRSLVYRSESDHRSEV